VWRGRWWKGLDPQIWRIAGWAVEARSWSIVSVVEAGRHCRRLGRKLYVPPELEGEAQEEEELREFPGEIGRPRLRKERELGFCFGFVVC